MVRDVNKSQLSVEEVVFLKDRPNFNFNSLRRAVQKESRRSR